MEGRGGGVDVNRGAVQLGAGNEEEALRRAGADDEEEEVKLREGATGASAPVGGETSVNASTRQILSR